MIIQISYHEVTKFLHLKTTFIEVLKWSIDKLNLSINTLDIIFTNDAYLKELHKHFFDLDTKTDVITFNLNENSDFIEGEIYISIDRALDQSNQYKVKPEIEICRLLVHGCLHLAGYNDKNEIDLALIKEKENKLVENIECIFANKLYVEVK
jgi:probable rRNA maturation factor